MMNMRWISLWSMNTKLDWSGLYCVFARVYVEVKGWHPGAGSLCHPWVPQISDPWTSAPRAFPASTFSLLSHLTDLPSDFKICILVNFLGLENMQSFKFRLWCKEINTRSCHSPTQTSVVPLALWPSVSASIERVAVRLTERAEMSNRVHFAQQACKWFSVFSRMV